MTNLCTIKPTRTPSFHLGSHRLILLTLTFILTPHLQPQIPILSTFTLPSSQHRSKNQTRFTSHRGQ